MALTKAGKIVVFGVLPVAALVAAKFMFDKGSFLKKDSILANVVDINKALPKVDAGKQTNAVNCRINVWVGAAPGLVAAGGLETVQGSIYDKLGMKVNFKLIDDWTEGASALGSGNVDMMLTTVDVWAKDQAKFAERGFSAHAIMQVDWSRGADGVMARQGINSIEQLENKTLCFAPYTPSHFLIWSGLKNSSVPSDVRMNILKNAITAKDGVDACTIFAQGKADVAVGWDPDMTDAVKSRAGSSVVFDTKVARNLIGDVIVVSDAFAAKNPDTVKKFIKGWLQGVEAIRNEPTRAYNMIGSVKEMNIKPDLAKAMLDGVHLSGYGDNVAFFTNDYNAIFASAQEMYKELRLIKSLGKPDSSKDIRYLLALKDEFSAEMTDKPAEITAAPVDNKAVAISTQHKAVYFETGSAKISPDSIIILSEVADYLRQYDNTKVKLAGNTDSTGSVDTNTKLSLARAEAIKAYFVSKGLNANRFTCVGNGPKKPIADNNTAEGREKNRRTDILTFKNN